jgi:hypothetical protein
MAKGNWSKYNPKSRCFKCGKALSKKEVLHNPQNKTACKLHAAEQSVQPTGGTLPVFQPLSTPDVFIIEKFFSVPPTSG